MAVGMAVVSEGGEGYKGRMTPFVVLSCMVAATGGIIFGYDIGISGGVTSMDPFLKKFFPEVYTKMQEDTTISNYCIFDSQLLTSFTSSLYVAGLFASFFASSITKAFGRKPSILVGGVAFLAGSALGGAAFNVYMLILGRILLGFGVGFANQSVPLYLSEMAPPKHRGAINNGFHLSIGVGVLLANLINYGTQKIKGGWGWRISLAMAAIPASFITLGALFLPETPNSLIQLSNDHQKAKLMLQKVRGTQDVQVELDDLIKANEESMSLASMPPVLFRTIGLGESASLMSTVVTGGSTFKSMLIVDKLGRRVLLTIGGTQMLVSQIVIGSIMATQLGDHGELSKGVALWVRASALGWDCPCGFRLCLQPKPSRLKNTTAEHV
ncbi:hypothetical protein TEA_014968 [Camellia sinensis var. sinensis]|uniref:Major facilitator superfamily (MFS) profile domain-containing protein n=1 Tax=Camellia sinensis var. sinensis TaxID=542762 RepID=A0A4S4DN50_CAMSN|nr:hypothetical protein TEA_014968 [Camellia sinensis var. sinensis]